MTRDYTVDTPKQTIRPSNLWSPVCPFKQASFQLPHLEYPFNLLLFSNTCLLSFLLSSPSFPLQLVCYEIIIVNSQPRLECSIVVLDRVKSQLICTHPSCIPSHTKSYSSVTPCLLIFFGSQSCNVSVLVVLLLVSNPSTASPLPISGVHSASSILVQLWSFARASCNLPPQTQPNTLIGMLYLQLHKTSMPFSSSLSSCKVFHNT